jgi:nicotinate-nucleotide adenylyltransferase
MKKIGLLMGCFNPIHNDHLELAESVLNQGLVHEVWFVPAKDNLNTKDSIMLSSEARLQMLRLAIKGNKKYKISQLELKSIKQNYTYQNLKKLKKQDNELYLIIGSDNLKTFDKWVNYEEILDNYFLIVAPRNNDDIETILNNNLRLKTYAYYQKIIEMHFNTKSISSTEVRKSLNGGL